jgi:hypothetical protein
MNRRTLTSILGQIVPLRFHRGGKWKRSSRPSSQGIGVGEAGVDQHGVVGANADVDGERVVGGGPGELR